MDFPNSAKAKKFYLVLQCGLTAAIGKDARGARDKVRRNGQNPHRVTKVMKGSREWILMKKAKQARNGEEVKAPTKYTGKKRQTKWGYR